MRSVLLTGFLMLAMLALQAQSGDSNALSVLSWNIFMLPGIAAKSSPSTRAAAIGKLLSAKTYDVLVFQEAFSVRSRMIIYHFLHHQFPYTAGPANTNGLSGRTNSGVWILSRYPILKTESINFKSKEGTDALSKKGAMMVEINFNGRVVQIVGTHLQSAGDSGIRELQCGQIFEELLKPNRRDSVVQIICGDMNIDKYSTVNAYSTMLKSLHAHDTNVDSAVNFSFDPRSNDVCLDMRQRPKLIDYILVADGAASVRDAGSAITTLRQRWSPQHQDLSDHYSLGGVIQFRMPVLKAVASGVMTNRIQPRKFHDIPPPSTVYLQPEYQILQSQGRTSRIGGMSVMFPINRVVSLGFAGYATLRHYEVNPASRTVSNCLRVKLEGIKLSCALINGKRINVSAPLFIGIGSISVMGIQAGAKTQSQTEKRVIGNGTFFKPGIDTEIKLTKNTGLFIGAGVLLFTDADSNARLPHYGNWKAMTYSSGVRIGLF